MTIQTALKDACTLLSSVEDKSDSVQLDAELLLSFVLNKSREYLYTWPEKELTTDQKATFGQFCQSRCKGHPIAYLTGQRGFWNLDLSVTPQVLIPRPETELLVELTLDKLSEDAKLIADLGTGSGAIALALGSERPEWQLLACDISEAALDVARGNKENLAIKNVIFKQGKWCDAFNDVELDAIVSNPPYISPKDEHLDKGDVRFEPEIALVSGKKGLADLEIIAQQSLVKLKSGGWLLLEHGYQQGEAVRQILFDLGYTQIRTHRDLAENERVTCAKKR